jgi:hypothetical protein
LDRKAQWPIEKLNDENLLGVALQPKTSARISAVRDCACGGNDSKYCRLAYAVSRENGKIVNKRGTTPSMPMPLIPNIAATARPLSFRRSLAAARRCVLDLNATPGSTRSVSAGELRGDGKHHWSA